MNFYQIFALVCVTIVIIALIAFLISMGKEIKEWYKYTFVMSDEERFEKDWKRIEERVSRQRKEK